MVSFPQISPQRLQRKKQKAISLFSFSALSATSAVNRIYFSVGTDFDALGLPPGGVSGAPSGGGKSSVRIGVCPDLSDLM
jgi:hypothetical protein